MTRVTIAAGVEAQAIRKVFRTGGRTIVALGRLDLRIGVGERVAIVGPSGAGKTTTLAILGALERPTSGDVFIGGRSVARMRSRDLAELRANHLGFVFQTFNLLDRQTALENVIEGLVYSRIPAREWRSRAHDALELVGLGGRKNHYPQQLSGGERQRVGLARALVKEPALVVADEPTGNLDSESAAIVVDLLASRHRSDLTLVVATHDQAVAGAMDRQVRLRDGVLGDE